MSSLPKRPTTKVVKSFLARWETLDNYKLQEASLALLFKTHCPNNKQTEHVLLKVSALNDFYSTNIFNTYAVAKHIVALDIDQRLQQTDLTLVNDVALVTVGGKARNFYSFATKYCSHHLPDCYPIYDYYVEKMLIHFAATDGYAAFSKPDLKRYARLIEIIKEFRTHYGLERFSLRQIDIYLWLAGKESFPRRYAGA